MQDTVRNSNNFNFLRLLLAVLVLLSHSSTIIDGDGRREILVRTFHTVSLGGLAVNCFFLVSGYLIVQSWQRTPRLFTFLKKRIFRIYPGFIVATFVSVFLVGPLGAESFTNYFSQLNLLQVLRGVLFLQVPIVPPVFSGQPYSLVNGAVWTIAYEFRCYFLVAILGLLGVVKRRRLWSILYIFFLTLFLFSDFTDKINFWGSSYLLDNPIFFIRFFCFFFAGGCFYLFRDQISYRKTLILLFLPIVILSLFNWHAGRLILPTLGSYIFFGFAFWPVSALQNFGKSSDISYGVYLYGWPIQKLLFWWFPSSSPWLVFVLACLASFVCGHLSWHLIEKHFLHTRVHRMGKGELEIPICQIDQVPDGEKS